MASVEAGDATIPKLGLGTWWNIGDQCPGVWQIRAVRWVHRSVWRVCGAPMQSLAATYPSGEGSCRWYRSGRSPGFRGRASETSSSVRGPARGFDVGRVVNTRCRAGLGLLVVGLSVGRWTPTLFVVGGERATYRMAGETTRVVVLLDSADESEVPLEVAGRVSAAAPPALDIDVCSFYPPAGETFDVDVTSLGGAHRLDPAAYRRLDARLRAADVLHVHSNAVGAAARLLAARHGVRVVKSEHNPHTSYGPAKSLVTGSANGLSDAVVAVSEAVAASYARWETALMDAAGVERLVIPNGVDAAAVRRAADAAPPVDLPDGVLIGGGGRMVPQKNLATLLEAVAATVADRPDVRLVLTGDGPQRAALETLAADLGIDDHVTFTGFLPRRAAVYALYHHLDVYAFPSRYEGWGVAVGEAMAAGLPVVAGDVPALRAVVGDAGCLVAPTDPDAIAATLGELAADPDRRRRLGDAARRRIDETFPIERTVDAHLALYRRLAETPGGAE